jgi:hypothetical protein
MHPHVKLTRRNYWPEDQHGQRHELQFLFSACDGLGYDHSMDQVTLHNVQDIQADKRIWLEGLLGQQIRENQQVCILVFTPGAVPDEQTRRAAAARIERTLDAAEQHAAKRGITAQEADAAVAEAMEHVRPRRS